MRRSTTLWFSVYAVLWLVLFDLAAGANDGFLTGQKLKLVMSLGALLAGIPNDLDLLDDDEDFQKQRKQNEEENCNRSEHRHRRRNYVHDIFDQHGPYYVRRAYRMNAKSFWKLHVMLAPFMKGYPKGNRTQKKGARNGIIKYPDSVECGSQVFRRRKT